MQPAVRLETHLSDLPAAERAEALRLLEDEEVVRRLILDDFEAFARAALKIRTKADGLQPLAFNAAQRLLHDTLEQQRERTRRVRAIILKSRQQGVSTYIEGRFYWRTSRETGLQAYILTHEAQATENLFGMARRYHDHCPDWCRPMTRAETGKELSFLANDSGYKVGTAGNRGAGRSNTVQLFHGSEVAFWPSPEEHFAGVVQAVPDDDGTEIVLESTANGIGGAFYDRWIEAGQPGAEYQRIFIPWFREAKYRSDPAGLRVTPEERDLAKLYGLDEAQLAWRRKKIAELRGQKFEQEYPATWEEAFLASGRLAFDVGRLKALQRECFRPRSRMAYAEDGKRFADHDAGELRVWEKPAPNGRYVIGADVAEGLDTGDWSSADVLDQRGRQVAQWHGHVAPDQFGTILSALGKWYRWAYLGVERNNHGLTTLTKLRDLGYPHLHAERSLDDRGSGDKETKKLGWLTSARSKPLMIDELGAALRNEETGIACAETIGEMLTYRVDAAGRYSAQQGCFDDRVMSMAIAGQMLRASYVS